ncbi:MAG: hypothetical protein GVY32_00305 [Gammaproteobacteria bacterium]|jgi:hypothetical protein|nr:hypothetical protein [Gammaproteobacteria bacterium]
MTIFRPTLLAAGLLLALLAAPATAREVIRVHDVPRESVQQLHEIGDVWGVDRRGDYVSMYVTGEERRAIEALGFRTSIDDKRMRSLEYARSIDAEAWQRSGMRGIPGFDCYRTVDETKTDLSAMAAANPDLARWESIGQSWRSANGQPDGDDIYALVLANQNSPHDQAPFVLMAAQHARELTTAETATRFAEWLFDNYDTDPTARWLLDHREIHIIAQQNPDGRREVEDGDIWWRKNSNLNACPSGTTGVDLNRNSDYFWGDYSSGSACNETYRGTSAHSEPETQAIQDYLGEVFVDQWPAGGGPVPADAEGIFISLHSWGELILFAWEGSGPGASNNAPNHEQMAWLGRKYGFHTGYEVGRDILYSAGGTTPDFAYGEFGVAAYTWELGTDFHQSCSYFESTMVDDLLDSLIYAAKAARRPYQAPSGPEVMEASAIYNGVSQTLEVGGLADDTRFDRGGVSEAPASDPIEDIAEIRVSFDLPPDLAASWFTIAPASTATVSAFEDVIEPTEPVTLPRLLFFQAVDTAGNTGVPEAVWITQRQAAITPASLSATLPAGQTGQQTVTIENMGSDPLEWSIAAEAPTALRGGYDPTLDEALALEAFSLPGGGTHTASVAAGQASRGQVVGFSFEGTVSNLGNNAWASDMAMTITAPEGQNFIVGGYQTSNPDWDFQGSVSGSPGTYNSQHIGAGIFGDEGALDEGSWSLGFEDTWTGGMDWSDLTLTLHKQEPPECASPGGIGWLSFDQTSGSIAAGESTGIGITIDTDGLAQGPHEALLCLVTDDPTAELTVIELSLQVTSGEPQIFRDRFEPDLP